jgi:hypothetical protein
MGLELIAEVFNLFNETNPSVFNGQRFTATGANNPNFRQPTAYAGDPGQGEQRLIQLGARFHF